MENQECKVYELYSLSTYKFVVILSFFKGEIVLSRHKKRTTWETQGGHIEPGETPMEAARRELFEESGAEKYTLRPLFDYQFADGTGMVFEAAIESFSPLPESEMAEIGFFSALPENLTYPKIAPILFEKAARMPAAREVWDAYDKEGNKLGFDLYRDEGSIPLNVYHGVVEVFPVSMEGEVLVTKRAPEKRFPLMWETTGGSMLKSETPLQAARRELFEETGLDLSEENFEFFETYTDPGMSGIYFRYIARFQKEKASFRLQEGETVDFRLLSWEDFWHCVEWEDFVPVVRSRLLTRRFRLERAIFGK